MDPTDPSRLPPRPDPPPGWVEFDPTGGADDRDDPEEPTDTERVWVPQMPQARPDAGGSGGG